MKRHIWLFLMVAILSGAIGIYLGVKKFTPEVAHASAVVHLFNQSMPDAKGQVQSLGQWKGKTLLVNFWATWCTPCVQEMPELSALQAEVLPKDIRIIGIAIDNPANIAEFSLKYKIGYPLYSAARDGIDISRQLGNQVGGLPFTVLIGRDGQVKKTYLGRLKIEELHKDLTLF